MHPQSVQACIQIIVHVPDVHVYRFLQSSFSVSDDGRAEVILQNGGVGAVSDGVADVQNGGCFSDVVGVVAQDGGQDRVGCCGLAGVADNSSHYQSWHQGIKTTSLQDL